MINCCIVMTSACLSKTVAGRVEQVPRSQWLQLHHHRQSVARQDVVTSASRSVGRRVRQVVGVELSSCRGVEE